MPFNGSGVYSLPLDWNLDAANGIPITSSRMMTQQNDQSGAFNNCVTRDGQGSPSANIPWNNHKITGLAAATTAGDALSWGGAGVVGGLVGTTTNDNAATGYLGEYVTSTVIAGGAVSLTTGVAANITSVSLTAGDWDLSGNVVIIDSGTGTLFTQVFGWINGASATAPTLPAAAFLQNMAGIDATFSFPVGTVRVQLTTTTTVFLSCRAGFSVSTAAAYGVLNARRMR